VTCWLVCVWVCDTRAVSLWLNVACLPLPSLNTPTPTEPPQNTRQCHCYRQQAHTCNTISTISVNRSQLVNITSTTIHIVSTHGTVHTSAGNGSWVKWVTLFDGSHGSWVTSCLPMTHQPQMNSVRHNKNNHLKWIPTAYYIKLVNITVLWCFKLLLVKLFQYLLLDMSDISSAFNTRIIITSQHNMMLPETVEALSISIN